ncbi:MAG TPA: excinuclease ABC subunit UvrC [Myxococcaceae bacterium]|nr:excinuclease ABC subunit UvrC [Myxococcaceae bacterium]
MPSAALEEKLERLPAAPGVYLMKDARGEVIYVGKAVNLRSRVRSYFGRSSDTRAFIPFLESVLADLDTVVVSNEKEALLLENELIKRHQPRFNVLLKDDKNFICLRLDPSGEWPRLEVVRRFKRDGAMYFGPYASASSIRETLRIINRYFQLRTCSDHVLHHRKRPCLLHQIGRCPAPCVYDVSRAEYAESVREVALFLEGKGGELLEALRGRMKAAAQALRFEQAARLRDQLFAIERSLERQKIATTEPIDQDVFGYHREADRLVVYVLYVRQGRLNGGQAFPFTGQEFPDEELLGSFVNLYYGEDNVLPDEVLLPLRPEGGLEPLAELLTEKRGRRVRVLVPQRGEKLRLVEMSVANARQALLDQRRSRDELEKVLERLQDRLHLSAPPRRMECFDISHFQGSSIVASQVAMTDGELDRARYRRFRIKSVQAQNDFASMYEVVSRRLRRGQEASDLPDLLVIDGGKGQLASARAAMKDVGVTIDVVGLAKSRELDSDDGAGASARSPERVFIPEKRDPIVLPQNSPELFLLVRLRDEAHRFAITYQQKLMRRRNFKSVLEDIPGVGEGRKKALLRAFGSLKRIREASIEELASEAGVGTTLAERIHAHLHATDAELRREVAEGQVDGDAVREASLEDAVAAESPPDGGV